MKESYNRDPLIQTAEALMLAEDVAKIKKKVAQLKVGDKTNFGTVLDIGDEHITFKAPQTPKTKILFRQRALGRSAYLLMNLVKYTPDGKGLDKSFKEANDFTGAAAAAAVAGEDEFEFNGKTYPVEMDIEVAKKIMSQSLKLAKQLAKDMEEDTDFIESNEFVGAAAAAKVAGKDEFEFNGKTYPVEISQETAEKIMSQAIELAKDLAKAKKDKKEESTELEEETGSLQNSLKVLSKAGIGKGIARPGRVTDMPKLAKAIHKNYKAITGEKYQDGDQVAMSEIIADLIGHFRIDGDEFITAWDSTIREDTEQLDEVRTKPRSRDEKNAIQKVERLINSLPGIVKNLGYIHGEIDRGVSALTGPVDDIDNLGKLVKEIEKLSLNQKEYNLIKNSLHEETELEESDKDKYMWSDINNALMGAGLNPRVIMNVLSKLKGKALKEETEELDESEHGEWFTCEIHVKSSGQLYSTFYVQAKDMGQAKKKADNVFKELMKTTYPKDWPSYSKKFTVKVMKGDNIGELMP